MKNIIIPRLFIIVLAVAVPLHVAGTQKKTSLEELFELFDSEITHAKTYLDQRQHTIDSISEQQSADWTPEALLQVGELYRPYQCDSAVEYFSKALSAPEPYCTMARIRLVYTLASIGYYSEGFRMAESIGKVPNELKVDYYEAMNRINGEASVYGKMESYREHSSRMAALYEDSLLMALTASGVPSIELYQRRMVQARNDGNYRLSLQESDSAMSLLEEDSHKYAILAYEKAITYRDMGDETNYRDWLVRSAIADVRCGVTDNGSSWMLAQMVFADGEVERAYRYIEYSLSNAGKYNARLRYMQINPLGHIINQAYQQQQVEMSRRLMLAVAIVMVVMLLFVLVFIYTLHQNRKLHSLNRQLSDLNNELSSLNLSMQEANLVKEQYICRYLEVYSAYIRRLSQMARKAGVKDPDAFTSKEMDEFYRSFDNTFLSLYRSFVTDFNALLRPEERIVPKQGELLTTELRIFALIRLGIDSSAKIAELLCYSPNTIYNYRARVKNAAIGDREEFEDRVKNLCTNQPKRG